MRPHYWGIRLRGTNPEVSQPGVILQSLKGAIARMIEMFFGVGSIPRYSRYLTAYSYSTARTKASSMTLSRFSLL